MTIFCNKNLKRIPCLSELFRENREKQGWDIRSIHFRTHIPSKYVSVLESGNFEDLPRAKAHRIAYVREYATALGLNPNTCLEQFCKEEGLKNTATTTTLQPKRIPFGSLSILVRNFLVGSLVAGLAAFLVFQVKNILQAPNLMIFNPSDGFITPHTTLTIEGATEKDVAVKLNGQEVALDNQNHFTIPLDLVSGLNTLVFTATKKHGKTTEKTFNVIVKPNTVVNNTSQH